MNPNRLFTASCAALITTAMSFALRGGATGDWMTQFNLTGEQAGWVNYVDGANVAGFRKVAGAMWDEGTV